MNVHLVEQIQTALQLSRTALESERRTYFTLDGADTVEDELQAHVARIDLALNEIVLALAAVQKIK